MERRKEKEREGRGRGGEKMKKKLSSILIMMIFSLMIGCNNGGESAEGNLDKVMIEVGKSAENIFYSFMSLIVDALGLRVTSATKKSEIAGYFNNLGEKLGKASDELETVAVNAEGEGVKGKSISLSIREAVETAKTTLKTLKSHLESFKEIGDSNVVAWTASNAQGVAAADSELRKAYNALKGIVEISDKEGVVKLEVGNTTLNNGTDNKEGAKILSTDSSYKPSAGDAGKAAAIVSTVSGKEMLASIVKSDEVKELKAQATVKTTPLEFAKGATGDYLGKDATPKAAAVAGGIALRSLVKDGKLASNTGNNDDKVAQSAGVAAVNKLLGAVEDIIKKTVKNVLEKAKTKIDEARKPKAVGNE